MRLPDGLADDAEAAARVQGISVNALIIEALRTQIDSVRQNEDFTARAKLLIKRDGELLERLAR